MGLQFGEHTDSRHNLIATKRGELHYMRLRHADDTGPEGFVQCKTPTTGIEIGRGSEGSTSSGGFNPIRRG